MDLVDVPGKHHGKIPHFHVWVLVEKIFSTTLAWLMGHAALSPAV